jgi:hypothetical protein
MRKSAIRRIRAQFEHDTGHAPSGVVVVGAGRDGTIAYVPSAWRRLKKSYTRSKSNG